MKLILLNLMVCLAAVVLVIMLGCTPITGVRIVRFSHEGQNYVACKIVNEEGKDLPLAGQSLEACKQAIAGRH